MSLPTAARAERKVIAVFDIQAKGVPLDPDVLDRLRDYVATKVAATGNYSVVPAAEIKQALARAKSESYKSCYDESCQIEIGKEVAAEKSMSITLLKLGSQCAVALSVYDLARASTDSAASEEGGCTEDGIIDSLKRALPKVTGKTVAVAPPPPPPPPPPLSDDVEPETKTGGTMAETKTARRTDPPPPRPPKRLNPLGQSSSRGYDINVVLATRVGYLPFNFEGPLFSAAAGARLAFGRYIMLDFVGRFGLGLPGNSDGSAQVFTGGFRNTMFIGQTLGLGFEFFAGFFRSGGVASSSGLWLDTDVFAAFRLAGPLALEVGLGATIQPSFDLVLSGGLTVDF